MRSPKYTDTARYKHGYRKSTNTDIRATFRRVKQEQAENIAEQAVKVAPLRKAK